MRSSRTSDRATAVAIQNSNKVDIVMHGSSSHG